VMHSSINPAHQRGLWWPRSQFFDKENLADWHYLVKPQWLADEETATKIDDAVLELSKNRPVMLINTAGERMMLTPDHWPDSID
jgi:hypothetical protein